MKKIFILAIFVVSFLVSLLLNSGTFVCAESLNDLSYAKGENLADPENLILDVQALRTDKNIYLREVGGEICVQLEERFLDNLPIISIFYYDIDFVEIGKEYYEPTCFDEYASKSWAVAYFDTSDYEDAYSFSIGILPVNADKASDVELMVSINNGLFSEYEPYEKAAGLIDISVSHPILNIEYNYPLTVEDITELLKSSDGYDGDITRLLEIDASEYLESYNILGKYEINVSVEDSNDNTQTGLFYINVVDWTEPTIVGSDTKNIPLYTNVTDELILENYTAFDEYDGDLTDDMIVISSYTTYPESISSETVDLKITDKSGNYTVKTITVNYYDNVSPTLTCPTELTYSYQINMSLSDIQKDNVSTVDNLEEDEVTIEITKDEYTGNEKKVGTYEVEFTATDKSGNISVATIEITVSDTIKPVIFLDTYQVKVTDSVNLERADFDDLLYATDVLSKEKNYSAFVLMDTYTGHESEAGNYLYSIKYIDEDGSEIKKTFQIYVAHDMYTISARVENKSNVETAILIVVASVSVVAAGSLLFVFIKKMKIKR